MDQAGVVRLRGMAENSNKGHSLDLRASDADRERVAERLREAATHGEITLSELDERLETAYAAKTFGELAPVTADLPAGPSTHTGLAPNPARSAAAARIGGTPGKWRRSIAILSGSSRKGRWVVPPKYQVVTVMGGVEIDMREATFAEQVTVINLAVLMGGVEIKVPEGVEVHNEIVAIMGGSEVDHDPAESYEGAGGPVVRVTGVVVMGGVEVSYKPLKKKKRQGELSGGETRELDR
jgi:Domain of unknown function (DUF1707)/Cell wall-active antibiotics response 4TMS YvqF